MRITELEAKMIKSIAEDDLTPLNGARPQTAEDATTWANCVINNSIDKGVFTSLLKKGLVSHEGKGVDATVGLTDSGFEIYQTL